MRKKIMDKKIIFCIANTKIGVVNCSHVVMYIN